jgi:hypothetical protein
MAPNKFEQHIKETLSHRTLQPSPDAWNTLSKRLDVKSVRSKNKPYWWIGVAAGLVGVILVTTLVNNKDTIPDSNSIIVDNPKPIKDVLENVEIIPDSNKSSKPIIIEEKINKKQSIQASNEHSQITESKSETDKSPEIAAKALTFEEQKIQDVVAEIQLLKDNNSNVSDSEIDNLLLKAQKEISLNKLSDNKGAVDAKLLLEDVEDDIDQSFRSKVFEALKDGLGTVKSAVANRNN